jgi:hypothetical protein
VIRSVIATDALVARSRVAWGWAGQVALCWLGLHLAADRLDDRLGGWLGGSGIAWPEPEQPLVAATWTAVALELWVAAWLLWTRSRSTGEPVTSGRAWRERASVEAVVAPVALLVFGLAGSWVMAMAVEDGLAGAGLPGARILGGAVGVGVALRLALPAAWRSGSCPPVPRSRGTGLLSAGPVLALAALAARHGLPVWGWWP